MTHKHLRTQLIVNRPIQYKFLVLLFLSILLPACLTFGCLVSLIQSIIVEAQIQDEMVHNALLFVSQKIYIVLGIGFCFLSVLLLCWGVIFSHRIVGPLFRLERELDNVIAGKHINQIRFRKHDYFTSLADKVNTLIERLQSK